MILLIAGGTHTGKTKLAQGLMEQLQIPYLSMDHLKMGLIRSGQTDLTPMDPDEALTDYLWPIVREMIKTAVENNQSMIVEGCYIPHDWAKDFGPAYLSHIRCRYVIFSRRYIESHGDDILTHANDIEQRLDSSVDTEALIRENERNLELCKKYGCGYLLSDEHYDFTPEAFMA